MLDFLAALRRPIRAEDVDRLTEERKAADKRYNDALTDVDQALPRVPEAPDPPRPFDEYQVTPLNERWDIMPADVSVFAGGWGGRIRMLVWRMLAPIFEKQQAFNSALVDHVNRNIPGQREIIAASATTIAVLGEQLAALATFHSRLIVYLQQITPYIDTKDREFSGYAEHRIIGLAAGLAGLTDEVLKRYESLVAHERRLEGVVEHRTAAAEARLQAFEESLGAATRMATTLKRELDRLHTGAAAVSPPAPPRAAAAESAPSRPTVDASVDSYKYVAFEDRFRGSLEEIRGRLSDYLPYFAGATDVVDIGCGRGELLDLLRENGVSARGVDVNHEMVELCRERGLDVTEGDGLTYLRALPDDSLGGLIAAQVVEHLTADYLIRFLDEAYRTLRPDATIVLETINPTCWYAFFESYIRDITHRHPLHPDTMKYLLVSSGFQQVQVLFRAPYPEDGKLRLAPEPSLEMHPDVRTITAAFNANVARVNSLLFTYLDYAAVGIKK